MLKNEDPETPTYTFTLVDVVYHVTAVAIGHGLLKKFWPFWYQAAFYALQREYIYYYIVHVVKLFNIYDVTIVASDHGQAAFYTVQGVSFTYIFIPVRKFAILIKLSVGSGSQSVSCSSFAGSMTTIVSGSICDFIHNMLHQMHQIKFKRL